MASQGVFGRYEREPKPAKRRRLTAKFKAHLTIGGICRDRPVGAAGACNVDGTCRSEAKPR